jgi:hypothetical protein
MIILYKVNGVKTPDAVSPRQSIDDGIFMVVGSGRSFAIKQECSAH